MHFVADRGNFLPLAQILLVDEMMKSSPKQNANQRLREVDLSATGQLRVLVVDDDALCREFSMYQLARLGCSVSGVSSGSEAVESHARERWDLILMDCQMPLMNGFEATTCMRIRESIGTLAPTLVVALTGNLNEEVEEQSFRSGMNATLSKPMSDADASWVVSALKAKAELSGFNVSTPKTFCEARSGEIDLLASRFVII